MSKLSIIKEKLSKILMQFATVKTDKAVLEYDGDELKEGINVYVTNEDGERTPAEDGDYTLEDGKVVTVADGKITAITEPVEEETPSEETPKEDVNAEETEPEGTEGKTGEDAPKDKTAELVDEVAKLREDLDALIAIVNELVEKVGKDQTANDERLSKIEKMSAAQSAQETFETTTSKTITKTGNSKIDERIARMREMSKDWRNM